MELYIHIPFCIRKCSYCDFLSGPADRDRQNAYLQALRQEIRLAGIWRRRQPAGNRPDPPSEHARDQQSRKSGGAEKVTSLFIGGGTPSAVEAERIADILGQIRESFPVAADAEITMEANPGTLTEEKLRVYREAGINRLSLGLQSADDQELKLLGRIHTWQDFLENYQAAREAGFANINIDLMSALPGQTVSSWEKTLRRTIDCQPEHISAYSLILEEGTPFYDRYAPHPEELPDEDSDREMYHLTKTILAEAGYDRYEISNYSKPGYACRHNVGYWTRVPYLGLGLGASSLYQERRFHNTADMEKYIRILSEEGHAQDIRQITGGCSEQGPWASTPYGSRQNSPLSVESDPGRLRQIREEEEILTLPDRMEEFMFLGLRLTAGIQEEAFTRQFGVTLDAVYGKQLSAMVEQGLMVRTGGGYCLTDWGLDVSNQIFARFLLS